MAEEQIDKLTIEVESVGGDDKAIADLRKQLEKLGRVDLSNTVRQLGDLRTALGYLGTVDESVKSMLDNMVKLGASASRTSSASKPFNDIAKSAKQASSEMGKARKEYESWWESALNAKDAADRIYEAQKSSYENQKRADYISWWESQFRKADSLEKKQAAGDWFDQHAGSKNYYEEMAKGSFDPDESFVPLKTLLARIKEEFFGVGESAKDAGKKAEKALSKTDTAAKKAHKSTSKLGDAFIRIVRFKIVAATMQAVIQAAKEGTTALGEFDDGFKDTLKTYEAAGKAMSGGLGLALAPALEAAAPLVEYIADGIGSIGNGISAIVAMLKGEGKYQAVKSVEKIKEEMAAAEEKAEKVRKLISGFDELNIFSSDKEDSKINPFETIYFDTAEGNQAFKDDLKTLLEFITAAAAVAAIVALLKSAFSDKNKTLKEQTDLTKEDIKETVKLGDTAKVTIPALEGLTSALGLLGGLNVTPGLNPVGVKEGVGIALENIDKYVKVTVPVKYLVVENKNALEPVTEAVEVVGDFVKITIPAKELEANPIPLLEVIEDAGLVLNAFGKKEVDPVLLKADNTGVVVAVNKSGEILTQFSTSPLTTIDIKGNSLPFVGAVEESESKASNFANSFGATMESLFDSLGIDWTDLMGVFETQSDEAGDNMLTGFQSIFDSIFADYGVTMDEFSEETGLTNEEIRTKFLDMFAQVVSGFSSSLGEMNSESSASFNQMNADFLAMLGVIGASMNETVTTATQNGRVKWGEMMNAFISSSNTTGGVISKGMSNTFDGIAGDWDETVTVMYATANNAFAQMEWQWKTSVDNMVDYYNEQLGSLGVEKEPKDDEGQSVLEQIVTGAQMVEGIVDLTSGVGGIINSTIRESIKEAVGLPQNPLHESGMYNEIVGGSVKTLIGMVTDAFNLAAAGSGIVSGSVGMHANGGLVTSGEFFMARENGIPEYIGSFGHQTGVANNEQIVSGISGGVEAVLAAYVPQIIRAIEENATAVNIGDDQIYRSAQRGAVRHRQITGQPAFW